MTTIEMIRGLVRVAEGVKENKKVWDDREREALEEARRRGWYQNSIGIIDSVPVPMLLTCPIQKCGARHIDEGEFAEKLHHTHACQACGHVWRPALVYTVGVQFLPGFKNEEPVKPPPAPRPVPPPPRSNPTGEG